MPASSDHWSNQPGRWPASLSPEAYALVPTISTPRPSPDGSRVAYSRSYDGRVDLWQVEVAGGLPIQLTGQISLQGPDPSQRHATALAWTPDGRQLVFAGKETGKLYFVSAEGGQSRAHDEGPGTHHSPSVAPDGTRVAYVAERGEDVDVIVAGIDGRSTRIVSQGDEYVMEPLWSPDGRHLLYSQWPHYDMPWDERALVVVDVETGERQVVAGGSRVTNGDASWSPDGSEIAFISDRDGEFGNLWVCEPDGSRARRLVREEALHDKPCWSPDGRRIAYIRNDDGDCQIWCWQRDTQEVRQISREPGVHSELAWIDNERLVSTLASPRLPADLWIIDIASGGRRRLTQSATGGVLGADLVMPEHVAWQSPDGLTIHGLLFSPPETHAGKHPLVLHIHGGPVGQTLPNWQGHIQYLVGRGYVVLAPNYRGSKGYGRAFMEKLYGDWGGGDLADNLAGVQLAIQRGAVDPGKVVAMGGSAGGYATLICMTKAADIFKAGVCRFGIADLATFTEQTWIFERHYIARLMGPPDEHNALYFDRSPIHHVANVKEPLLILQGEEDIVCHPSQMDSMVDALRRAGKDVEYHTYPGEGHGFKRIATLVDDAVRIDDFLVRKVLNR